MQQLKQLFSGASTTVRNGCIAVVTLGASAAAMADGSALETSAQTALTAAQTSGTNVGDYVVAAVAGLAVVGIVLAMVRKV